MIVNNILKNKNERITSYFSADRVITINGRTIRGHNGIDIVPSGKIITPESGVVTYVKDGIQGVDTSGMNDFGNNIKIRTSNSFMIRFCHLAKGLNLKVGDKVSKGDIIGDMGTTGYSTGVHLHFGLYDISGGNEIAIDPLPYLEGRKKIIDVVPPISGYSFNPGDTVKVQYSARDYNGNKLSSMVYNNIYCVMETKLDRVVIGIDGSVTAAVNSLCLSLVSPAENTADEKIKTGSKVKVNIKATDYSGSALSSWVYSSKFTVMEIKGERAVIGIDGNVTAAVNIKNLTLTK